MCYYFGGIIKIEDFNLGNTLTDEKSYENFLVYNVSYKTLLDAKPLWIIFDKIDGFMRVYDGARFLVLFGSEKYDFIYNRIRYLKGVKSVITYVDSHNYSRIKLDSYDSLPQEKTTTFYKVIILIKAVFNKNKNYYHGIFLE